MNKARKALCTAPTLEQLQDSILDIDVAELFSREDAELIWHQDDDCYYPGYDYDRPITELETLSAKVISIRVGWNGRLQAVLDI